MEGCSREKLRRTSCLLSLRVSVDTKPARAMQLAASSAFQVDRCGWPGAGGFNLMSMARSHLYMAILARNYATSIGLAEYKSSTNSHLHGRAEFSKGCASIGKGVI